MVLIDALKVVNTLGAGGFPPNQAVFGHGISDVASALLGEGDHHQNNDVLQDLSTHGPLVQAVRLREVATLEIQRAMNEQRVRRMLARSAPYKSSPARAGDCVAFRRPCTEKDGKKHEARRFGPADAIHISGATSPR